MAQQAQHSYGPGDPADGHLFHFSVTSQGSARVGDGPHEDSPPDPRAEPSLLTVRAWNLRDACRKAADTSFADWTHPGDDD